MRYSHILDPRTGRPSASGVVSVSVLAPGCTLADGLATAVMVLGVDEGLALVERLSGGVRGLDLLDAEAHPALDAVLRERLGLEAR